MTVAELIELLQTFDPEAVVMISDSRSIFNARPYDVRYVDVQNWSKRSVLIAENLD